MRNDLELCKVKIKGILNVKYRMNFKIVVDKNLCSKKL